MADFTVKMVQYAGIGEPTADGTPYSRQDGGWVKSPGASGGEANTASAAGSGASLIAGKTGVDLEFNSIKSENNLLSIAVDAVSHDVELTVEESNLAHPSSDGSSHADVASNTSARHTHSNSAVLAAVTASFLIADKSKLDGVESGATADQVAGDVPFNPNGSIAATDVQAAIQEVRDEAGGSALEVEDESVSLDAAVTKLNFIGSGVTAVENADHEIDITVAGGSAPVDSVAGKTGVVVLVAADVTDFDTEVGNNTAVALNTTHRGLTNNPHTITATQAGAVPVTGGSFSGNLNVGTSADSTNARGFKLGASRTGNGSSYIDLIGDTTYSDYGVRFIRSNNGENSSSSFLHRGTGALIFNSHEAGSIEFKTSNVTRINIDSAGVSTFSSFPITPSTAPTTDYQVANKKYVDDASSSGVSPFSDTFVDADLDGSDSIAFSHGLGRLPASISIYDSAGKLFTTFLTANTTTITLIFGGTLDAGTHTIVAI